MADPIHFELKPLSREGIAGALEKAMRYRFLNEPGEAESICQDILHTDPENQHALVVLLLALTDRFGKAYSVSSTRAQEILGRLRDDYERTYYEGIISERQAKAQLHQGSPGSGFAAYEFFRKAMECYETAEAIRPPGNDDAILRWNTCARIIISNRLVPRPPEAYEPALE